MTSHGSYPASGPAGAMGHYWEQRYLDEGKIWGTSPGSSAFRALELLRDRDIRTILVPGSGYGRNTLLFSASGFNVTGVEIAETACALAKEFDPQTIVYLGSVLDMPVDGRFDAVCCFSVLHLFLAAERQTLIAECAARLREGGFMFFSVFSEKEDDYGKGREVEHNTFESKPGRPAHYFTEEDLKEHFSAFEIVETGLMEEPENHGGKAHTHLLRYILAHTGRRQ